MRNRGWIRLAAALAALLLWTAVPAMGQIPDMDAAPDASIELTKKLAQKWVIAVRDFLPVDAGGAAPADVAEALPKVLRDNLELTGLFMSLPKESFLEMNARAGLTEGQPINFKEWTAVGSQHLIKAGFSLNGEELMLELRLYDVLKEKMILGKRYTGARRDGRKMINRFTNEVLLVLTGEAGVFGSQIVFVAGTRTAKSVMMTEFGGQEVVGVAGGNGPSFAPVISKGGAIAYIHRNGSSWELRQGDQVISAGPLHLSPAFMPDGSILAAMSGKHATNIYRFSGPGARPSPVTDLPGINLSPSASPDGSQMVFVSDRAGSPVLYVSSTSGGSVRRLVSVGNECLDPDWSPRGDRIVFSSKGDIYTITPDGGDMQRLTAGGGNNTRPTWSPDGRMIVFASNRTGRSMLYVMTSNGDMQRPIMPDYGGDQRDPYWRKAMPDEIPAAGQ